MDSSDDFMAGYRYASKVGIIFFAAFISATVNSYTGIRRTSQVHLWVGKTFGATNRQLLFKVAIPTALPMIFTGLRLALGCCQGCTGMPLKCLQLQADWDI